MYVYALMTTGAFKMKSFTLLFNNLSMNRVSQAMQRFEHVYVSETVLKCEKYEIYCNFLLMCFFFDVDKTFKCRIS